VPENQEEEAYGDVSVLSELRKIPKIE